MQCRTKIHRSESRALLHALLFSTPFDLFKARAIACVTFVKRMRHTSALNASKSARVWTQQLMNMQLAAIDIAQFDVQYNRFDIFTCTYLKGNYTLQRMALIALVCILCYTGCGRNSELIINKNNILLKVIDTNFSTSQFTMVLNFSLYSFTFCVQCLLGGHNPPQCTGAHELRSCA